MVGSFKKGTLLSNKLVADICVVLKTLPTSKDFKNKFSVTLIWNYELFIGEAVTQLANKLMEQLRLNAEQDLSEINRLVVYMNDAGFQIRNDLNCVQILITTQYQNIKKLDSSLHCKIRF